MNELVEAAFKAAIPSALRTYLAWRADEARKIVIEELRVGDIDEVTAAQRDALVGFLVTYAEAARQNAAFANLRLIAKVLARKTFDSSERKDDFLLWADILKGLLFEEAVFLAALQRNYAAALREETEVSKAHDRAVAETRAELTGPTKLFRDKDEFEMIGTSLSRTGFVLLVSAWGGMSFAPTKRLERLAEMASLQEWADAARAEARGE